jgi:hypothetical protein
MTGAGLVRSSSFVVAFAIVAVAAPVPGACACDVQQRTAQKAGPKVQQPANSKAAPKKDTLPMSELWVDPVDLTTRNAFYGSGGSKSVPDPRQEFDVTGVDNTGYSDGYTVSDGPRRWDVKIGREAQPELVVSRVLWLIGNHPPVMHFLPTWRRKSEPGREQLSARFRLQSDHDNEGEWAWRENPFTGTRQMKGLVVVNLLMNNWDFKTSNNRIYTVPRNGQKPWRWFVVQDLGASLGKSGWPIGNRNDIEAFESQGFIKGVENGMVEFDYRGRHRDVLEDITPADVLWACRLLDRITEKQWTDIFRAAAYPSDIASRFRAHLNSKIVEGLALSPASRARQ